MHLEVNPGKTNWAHFHVNVQAKRIYSEESPNEFNGINSQISVHGGIAVLITK